MYFNQWVDYSMSWTFIQIKWALWWIFNLITKQRSMLICNITSRQYSYTRVEKQRFTLAPEKTTTYLSTWNKIKIHITRQYSLIRINISTISTTHYSRWYTLVRYNDICSYINSFGEWVSNIQSLKCLLITLRMIVRQVSESFV
jgi:hypothetical protein